MPKQMLRDGWHSSSITLCMLLVSVSFRVLKQLLNVFCESNLFLLDLMQARRANSWPPELNCKEMKAPGPESLHVILLLQPIIMKEKLIIVLQEMIDMSIIVYPQDLQMNLRGQLQVPILLFVT